MAFEYQEDTKEFYKNDHIAKVYHRTMTHDRKFSRDRIIADKERAVIDGFLRRVPNKKVLDIPAGTGKLAPLFKSVGANVKACDISENMLSLASSFYKDNDYDNVDFQICDAEKIQETIGDHFDLAVCLRLLHRVPEDVKKNVLAQLASVADYTIVSFGVHSSYHKLRRTIRRMLFGGTTPDVFHEPLEAIHKKIDKDFEIIDSKWVFPWLSQEIIFLLRPRKK